MVGTISSPETQAQLRGAQAKLLKAKQALAEAVAQHRPAQKRVGHRQARLRAWKDADHRAGNITQQPLEHGATGSTRRRQLYVAANAQRDQAESQIKAAEADVERLQSIVVDLALVSPRSGRVQYRLARAGEVISPGQRILTILDLNDVYMTIYLPADASRASSRLGDEARTILDPIPGIRVSAIR